MNQLYLKRALELAESKSADGKNGPFGAVIVVDNKVIGEGWNKVVENNDPTAHAEIIAIRNACKTINSFSLKNGVIYSSCEPCPMCLAAIYWARLDKIVFAATKEDAKQAGFDDSFIYDEIGKMWTKRKIKMIHLLASEGKAVFDKWNINPDKIPY